MGSPDADGNTTSDGIWDYSWDAENRLAAVQTTSSALAVGFPGRRVEFKYDYLGRRIEKLVREGWNGSAFTTVTQQRRFLYTGWSMVAEYSVSVPSTLVLTRSYTWGLDIARSLTDAGGVGALLQITDHGSGKSYLPAYDGNGNIAALFNASTGTVAAVYEYGPFGETLRADTTDPTIADNPFRFSTKYLEKETGWYDYGRRYYNPRDGRFIGRDPIEEKGGLHLYAFCGNNAANRWDVLGCVDDVCNLADVSAGEADGEVGLLGRGARHLVTDLQNAIRVAVEQGDPRRAPEVRRLLAYRYACNLDDPFTGDGIDASIFNAEDWEYINYLVHAIGEESAYESAINGPYTNAWSAGDELAEWIAICQASRYSNWGRTTPYSESKPLTGLALIDAKLSEGIYDKNFTGFGGYDMMGQPFTAENGLRAAVFSNGTDNVLVFAGTSPGSLANWWANLTQAFGFTSSQYEAGIKIAQEQYAFYNGNLRFAGHSLGGGIASAAAIITGGSANTFNAAGVHDNTLRGVDRSNGSINYYYSDFDLVRLANALSPASAAGTPISMGFAGFHGIGAVISAHRGGKP